MALTNYFMQSILGILIYYEIGLGLGGNIGPSLYFPLGIGVFIIQIVFSHLWLKKFKYGPLEWIWRMFTYRKILEIKI